MKRIYPALIALAVILLASAPAFATSYTYPVFAVTPSAVPPGGTVTIVINNGAGSVLPAYLNGGYCTTTTGPYEGFLVNQILLTTPGGVNYLLGTSTGTLGKYPIKVGPSDSLSSIKFGPGVTSMSVTTAYGTYSGLVWRTGGKMVSPLPSTVTTQTGTYKLDFAGYILCGSTLTGLLTGRSSFDVKKQFTVPEFGISAMAVASIGLIGLAMFKRMKLPPK